MLNHSNKSTHLTIVEEQDIHGAASVRMRERDVHVLCFYGLSRHG